MLFHQWRYRADCNSLFTLCVLCLCVFSDYAFLPWNSLFLKLLAKLVPACPSNVRLSNSLALGSLFPMEKPFLYSPQHCAQPFILPSSFHKLCPPCFPGPYVIWFYTCSPSQRVCCMLVSQLYIGCPAFIDKYTWVYLSQRVRREELMVD